MRALPLAAQKRFPIRCGLIIDRSRTSGTSDRSRSSVTALVAVVAWNRGACEDNSPPGYIAAPPLAQGLRRSI
ncbi:MAG TPA: hypothetical protein PK694_04775 [Rhodospirillales bacterium]|jgi:hypothetical protein|nr:hypothetical protein [Rhodospirillales bacterium]